MIYLCLDTCAWIYLVNGTEPVRILRLIEQEAEKGAITLLLPDIVITEFERNIPKAIHSGVQAKLADIEKNIDVLNSLLGEGDNPTFMDFVLDQKVEIEVFRNYRKDFKKIKTLISSAVKDNISIVQRIFSSPNTVSISSDSVAKEVLSFGLEKKAPFKGKNGTADAIIVHSFLHYVKHHDIRDAKFVSCNVTDFCEKYENKFILHSDLAPLFEQSQSSFFYKVADCINSFIKHFIQRQELEYIERLIPDENICDDCALFHQRKSYCEIFKLDFADNRTEEKVHLDENVDAKICRECSTFYIRCVSCEEWLYNFDDQEPTELTCEKCHLNYELHHDFDSNEIDFVTIEDILEKCEKCGTYFKDEGSGTNICEDCENNYSYN